ncbi:MAG: hypothetical protein HY381_01830 [Candidatus Chisholmbacteria bacterium]|nr:hypothetical protein [Candidatus Chisholmbacteria bacterium]
MFKSFRVSYWLVIGFVRKHAIIILLSLPLGFAAYFSYLKLQPLLPQPQPYLRIGRVGRFNLQSLPLDIQNKLSSGLTSITPSGEATPSLALNWEVSDDNKTYTFHLTNRFWHNGEPLKSPHLTYSIKDVDTSYPDDTTIEFHLKEPYAPFPIVVSQPVFRPSPKLRLRLFSPPLLGTGDYRLTKVTYQGQYLTSIVLQSSPDKIRYTFYPTEEAAILGFKLGEVDTLVDITDPQDLKHWPRLNITPVFHPDRFTAVFFNTQDPILADKNIRQALTYAIPNKPADQTRALSSFNSQSWAYNPQVKPYLTNPDTARQLLQKSQEETQSDTLPILDLLTTLTYLPLAEAIKTSWENLGVTTRVHVITHPPQDFQALLIAHQIPPDPDQYTLWHSSQLTNLSRFQSPKLDKLLEDGRQTLDPDQRKQIYQDFQRFLVEDSPAAFLFYQTTYTISRD